MSFDFYSSFDLIDLGVPAVFVVVLVLFVMIAVKGILQWNQNNHSPRLTVPALLVAKRIDVSHYHTGGEHDQIHTDTTYYATFQVESGDRMEFCVDGFEYGSLAEGDYGDLSFQGTRYLGFERTGTAQDEIE